VSTTPARAGDPGAAGRRGLSLAAIPRNLILAATRSPRIGRWARRYGLSLGATRFVAGEELDDCVGALRELSARGVLGYAIKLGESVTDAAEIEPRLSEYQRLAERLADERIGATMAIKLSSVGLAIDQRLALEAAREVVGRCAALGVFVRLDMEQASTVDATLAIYRQLREEGFDNTGVVLQAYLHRTLADLEALRELEPNVRVVKGAYLEAASVAFAHKRDVDRNFLRLIDAALQGAGFTAIATHDEAAIAHALALLGPERGRAVRHEFQMLYGVRTAAQERLVAGGQSVRVCVPYGPDWFVYFGRRLAERPANLLFVARSLVAR